MFPNPLLAEQMARDKKIEIQQLMRTGPGLSHPRGAAWRRTLFVLGVFTLVGANILNR